jgi:hypothetical protein
MREACPAPDARLSWTPPSHRFASAIPGSSAERYVRRCRSSREPQLGRRVLPAEAAESARDAANKSVAGTADVTLASAEPMEYPGGEALSLLVPAKREERR